MVSVGIVITSLLFKYSLIISIFVISYFFIISLLNLIGEKLDWIDNVYSSELITEQLNYYDKYQNVFINSIFGQEELLQTTSGIRHIYNNKDLALYTSMTSIGSDESTVDMAFIDVTSNDASIYLLTGTTEDAAKKSAEGKVQNLGYKVSFPIPVNVNI